MRLILSRKGFDSSSGGCPSPIFPDGSMIALPIPDKRSPIRYQDMVWRGRNLGELVATLTKGRKRPDFRAHLDPDLRKDLLPREPGWRATLGQHGIAQGHLRKQGVQAGDVFLFWGLFRSVDDELRWVGRTEHRIWGWLQVGDVVPVDDVVRGGGADWRWASRHPHLAFPPEPGNTLYVASKHLSFPGVTKSSRLGHGTFAATATSRRLTAPDASSPLDWSLLADFLPRGRPPLTHHIEGSRCFYCGDAIRGEPAVDHFVPWARYPPDLEHNFMLADARCNGDKADRLAAFEHLERWCARNARPEWTAALEGRMLAHDIRRTGRVAAWAYGQADLIGATVWERGREGLVGLDPRWRAVLGP